MRLKVHEKGYSLETVHKTKHSRSHTTRNVTAQEKKNELTAIW